MPDLFPALMQSDAFMPHGMCYLWEPDLVWLHVVSDTLTGLAYWAIPPALVYLAWKARETIPAEAPYGRKRLPYDWVFVAFGLFIVACGATHFMGIWTIWEPRYWLEGGVKAVTALASVATAVALPPLVPRALEMLSDARDSELRRRQLESANRELEELSQRLREANRVKSEVVANVSHELRTPLSLILGPTDELLEDEDLGEETRKTLEVVRRNARSLLGQVDDLLDASRMELGEVTPELEYVDLAALVRETTGQFRSMARRLGTDLSLEAPDRLPGRADAEKVERVLLNLLSNAFKFTPTGGRIRVELGVRPGGGESEKGSSSLGRAPEVSAGAAGARSGAGWTGEQVVLEVRDSGPGVEPEDRERVFERFRQLDGSSTRGHGGTGLGLSLARELVEVQGGSIAVDDAPEGGARFTVRLPLRAPKEEAGSERRSGSGRAVLERARIEARSNRPEQAREGEIEVVEGEPGVGTRATERGAPGADGAGAGAADARPAPADADERAARLDVDGRPASPRADRRPSLLLVEDDPGLREFLSNILADEYRIREAHDGVAALRMIDEEVPDVVLTDVMMPRMDGVELVARLGEMPRLRDVPILVLTARADADLVSRLLRAGARDYILKPAGPEELRARIENHLDVARSRRILQRELATREDRLERLAGEAADQKRRLETLVEEKSLLVRELHHRVKGNLQTISSLLNLQVRRVEEQGAREALEESRGRIAAMALLHEKLYQTDDPTETRMDDYLESLLRDVVQSWGGGERSVRCEVRAGGVALDAERAVTCGLLVHELVSNALRHGFPDGVGGRIDVRLERREEDDAYRLSVADDGVGFPEDEDPERPGSLGLSLVHALTEQLGGTLRVEGEDGTRWLVEFPAAAEVASRRRTS